MLKYILRPFWRLLVALWVAGYQFIHIIMYGLLIIVTFIWNYKELKKYGKFEWSDTWYSWEVFDNLSGATWRYYYINPWYALIGKLTYEK